LRELKVKSAYIDGEQCALNADGVPVFSRLQAAMDEGHTDQLVFFAFDLLFLNGQGTAQLPLIERKEKSTRFASPQKVVASSFGEAGRATPGPVGIRKPRLCSRLAEGPPPWQPPL
jgi:ATP-dependent DNA ligase